MKNKFLTKLLCFVISIMMIIPTGISFVAAAGEEDPFEALAAYGGYADTYLESNLQIYSNDNNAPANVYEKTPDFLVHIPMTVTVTTNGEEVDFTITAEELGEIYPRASTAAKEDEARMEEVRQITAELEEGLYQI